MKSASKCEACGRYPDILKCSCLIICEMREREGCLALLLHGQLPCSQRWEPEKGGKKPFKDIRAGTRMSLTVNLSEAMLPRLIGSQEFS